MSGNVDAVTDALRKGKLLDASLTSWVYVPRFRTGDPENVAILWESKPGLYYDGRRNDFGGHAVLLLNGDITNIPAADWAGFLKRQEELRKTLQSSRIASTNAPAQGYKPCMRRYATLLVSHVVLGLKPTATFTQSLRDWEWCPAPQSFAKVGQRCPQRGVFAEGPSNAGLSLPQSDAKLRE